MLPLLHVERKPFQLLFVSSWHLQTEGQSKELGHWQSDLCSLRKSLVSFPFSHNNSSSQLSLPNVSMVQSRLTTRILLLYILTVLEDPEKEADM